MEDRRIVNEIVVQLNYFKFRRSSISYQYLIDAIFIVVKDKNTIRDFKKLVYNQISEKYNTRPENVQWSLNKLINVMYLNTSPKVIYDYFSFFVNEKPTLKFFIISIARNVHDNINSRYIFNEKLTRKKEGRKQEC